MPLRLGAFYFLFFAQAGAYVAYFPLYLADRGLGAFEIAWVLALPPITRTFAPAVWGWVADATGAHRAIVAFGCAAAGIAFALLPFTDHIALLIAILSMLSAGALPLVEAITLGSLAGQHGRYGPIRVWGSIGFIATVLAGGVWLDYRPLSTLPTALALFLALTFIVALGLPRAARHPALQGVRIRFTPAVRALLGAGFWMAVAHGALYAFLSLHLDREGYSGTAIGVLWTLGVIAEIFVFLYLPQLFRRYALSTILVASLACAVARFLAIGWAAGFLWIVVLAQLLHGATFGAFHAASVAVVQRVFPEGAQARGQTLFSSLTYGAGGGVGLVAAGWAWEVGAAPLAFSVAAAAAFAGACVARGLKNI